MVDRLHILVVHIDSNLPSFVKKDIDLLSKNHDVRPIAYRSRRDVMQILTGTLWADVTISWFAWDQAAWAVRFSKLFRRKSIVVVGGFDVVNMPEISYGNLLSPTNAARTRYAIKNASKVIAISQSLKTDAVRFSGRKDIEIINLGFDATEFTPNGHKEPIALTVGAVTKLTMKRKGIETFIKAAQYAPDIEFHLIGVINRELEDKLRASATPNLKILGRVDQIRLLEEMRRAAVYVQVSAHEGFGCSLAEAMLCGCVPIVSDRGAIPEVVGDAGFYAKLWDAEGVGKLVLKALGRPDLGTVARDRISRLFPLEKRERLLMKIVNELLK